MIRFPAKTVRAAAAGRTSQLRVIPADRRQVKRKDADRRQKSATRWSEPWAPRVGAEEHLRASEPDKHDTAHIVITAKRRDQLGNLTHTDAKAMGYGNIDTAKAAWVTRHDDALIARQNRTHLTPENLALVLAEPELRAILCRRFDDRWSDVSVWVIDIRPAVAPSCILAAAGKGVVDASGNGDYTTVPAHGLDREAGGVIDAATLERYAEGALGFCIGKQLARQKAMTKAQAEKKAARRPWAQAA